MGFINAYFVIDYFYIVYYFEAVLVNTAFFCLVVCFITHVECVIKWCGIFFYHLIKLSLWNTCSVPIINFKTIRMEYVFYTLWNTCSVPYGIRVPQQYNSYNSYY